VNNQLSTANANAEEDDKTSNKKLVCYYTNWSQLPTQRGQICPQKISTHSYAHISSIASDGWKRISSHHSIQRTKPKATKKGTYERVIELKKKNPDLKVLLAVGKSQSRPMFVHFHFVFPFQAAGPLARKDLRQCLPLDTIVKYLFSARWSTWDSATLMVNIPHSPSLEMNAMSRIVAFAADRWRLSKWPFRRRPFKWTLVTWVPQTEWRKMEMQFLFI